MTNHAKAIEAAGQKIARKLDVPDGMGLDLARACIRDYLAAMEAEGSSEIIGRAMDACLETGCIRADKMAEWLSANGFMIAARPREGE